ncbi:cytochrome P450 [Lactarius indigo]|nr:cytochrome P450 [Lactarius indigo]
MPTSPLLDFVALSLFAYLVRTYAASSDRGSCRGLQYPPGPRGLPLLGNLFDIPQYAPWETYARWGRQYGDVTSISVIGRLVVFVNSARAARDLLEHRGSRYMDRPETPIIDMMEAHFNPAVTRYGHKWRVERRIIGQSFRPTIAVIHQPMQTVKAHVFLRQVLRCPEKTMEYLKHFTGAVVMSLTYGYDVKESGDHHVAIAEEFTLASESILPSALLVNDFPALKHLPDWFPGQRRAQHGMRLSDKVVNEPFNMAKEDLLKGTSRHSLVHDNFDECMGDEVEEAALKNAAATVYAAGAETTISALSSFFLALLLYPDVQTRAQAEIDQVIGRSRLPAFSDRPKLPYVDAICKELLRWRLVLPLGVAHATTEDDVYMGYFIPKGTTVLANTWAILHDAEVYVEPEEFKPERFLTADGKVRDDPLLVYAFGYGRRVCPGRHLVDSTLWILVVSVLATFNVRKKIDLHGNEIAVEGVYEDAPISHPAPFEYAIMPRYPRAARLVQETSISIH